MQDQFIIVAFNLLTIKHLSPLTSIRPALLSNTKTCYDTCGVAFDYSNKSRQSPWLCVIGRHRIKNARQVVPCIYENNYNNRYHFNAKELYKLIIYVYSRGRKGRK